MEEGYFMKRELTESEYLRSYHASDYPQISIATDIVCFSVLEEKGANYRKLSQKKLSILLIKRGEHPFKDQWALPGGFLKIDETLEETAKRELREETGVEEAYMEQLYTFSALDRDPRTRVVSTAYLALLNQVPTLKATTDAIDTRWFEVTYKVLEGDKKQLILVGGDESIEIVLEGNKGSSSQIAFDHVNIITFALERLRGKIEYTPIAMNLLPEYFTLTSLQQIYEAILGKTLLVANFRRKIKELVEETQDYAENGGHRPSKLYKRRDEKYE